MRTNSMQQRERVAVKVSRRFNATAERIFDSWLDPQRARHFLFTRPGQVVVRAEIDARVGGSFLFIARRDGIEIDHVGKYLEIDRPRRLVFTLRVPTVWADDNRVTVEIDPLETGCELTLTHEGVLPHHESRIESGWTVFLEGLQAQQPRAVTDSDTILATADVEAPPERVFRALTTDEVERWWGSADTYRVTQWTADLRAGGRWSLVVRHPDGNAFPASGQFLELDPPHKLVQTRKYDWDSPGLGRRETRVTFRLDPIPRGTRVTVRHDGFAGLWEPANEHAAGWERFLGWLTAYLKP